MTLPRADVIILDASQVVTPPPGYLEPLRGEKLRKILVLKNCSVAINSAKGSILAVAPWKEIKDHVQTSEDTQIIRGNNQVVLPGFVDPHTHPVYSGSRVNEFILRSQGASYMEIHKAGGGIQKTVTETQAARDKELTNAATSVFLRMLDHGTTTVEAKSGYGLTTKDEIRILEIINKSNKTLPLSIIPTFLGAHSIPDEYLDRRKDYINIIINEMIPQITQKGLAKFCDVFCEEGAFSVAESMEILQAAKGAGLMPKLHADEFNSIGGTELGVALGAVSVDHLLKITQKGVALLASSKTSAILLPGTSFFLNMEHYAPARYLIDEGAFVALGTDYNAGSCLSESMQMVCSLAVIKMKMTPEEAVNAATFNASCSLGMGDRIGTIAPGKQADLILFDIPDYKEFPYHFGVNLVSRVIKKGKVVK